MYALVPSMLHSQVNCDLIPQQHGCMRYSLAVTTTEVHPVTRALLPNAIVKFSHCKMLGMG